MKYTQSTEVWKICIGPEIDNRGKCIHGCNNKSLHKIKDCTDVAAYSGIINWRCPTCFKEHRDKINSKKNNDH